METGTAVIIVGVNRGGTSAIAATLNSLGIFLGERWHEPIYEDLILANAFRNQDWKSFRKTVEFYESNHSLFGWKLPNITTKLTKVHRFFKAPKYIFVFRDLYATGTGMNRASNRDVIKGMFYANQQYKNVLDFISRKDINHLLISYEKMIIDSKSYAIEILDFLEIEKNDQRIKSITEVISPNPEKYQNWLNNSRQSTFLNTNGYQGHLDHLDTSKVKGWAKSIYDDNSISVDIFVNDEKITSIKADELRKDLIHEKVSTIGKHGFLYYFDTPLLAKSAVSVKPANNKFDLVGSPKIIDY